MILYIPFSIHSPLAGRDTQQRGPFFPLAVFNPLAPCGARPPSNAGTIFVDYFQSTRPLRGETMKSNLRAGPMQFSIHSPLAGRDAQGPAGPQGEKGFQSTRPLRGETFPALSQPQIDYFSIHSPLAGRDNASPIAKHSSNIFNPLAPCGARQNNENYF